MRSAFADIAQQNRLEAQMRAIQKEIRFQKRWIEQEELIRPKIKHTVNNLMAVNWNTDEKTIKKDSEAFDDPLSQLGQSEKAPKRKTKEVLSVAERLKRLPGR